MLASKLLQSRKASHLPVVIHDLAQDPGRSDTGHPRQVHRGLGVAGSFQHTAPPRAQRKHVTGPFDVLWSGARIHQRTHGCSTVVGGDAGGRTLPRFDADTEGGAVGGGVLLHHQRKLELVAPIRGQRDTDQAAPEAGHEVDRLRTHLVGSEDQITFVLAVLVVYHDHLLAAGDTFHRLFNGNEDVLCSFGHGSAPTSACEPGGLAW